MVDTSLFVLLVVGSASKRYISLHRRLSEFTIYDFDMLGLIIADFSEIVLVPHVVAETSTLVRQIDGPAYKQVQASLRTLIETCAELPVQSITGAQRVEFEPLGLTDSILLHLCTLAINGIRPTLVTTDEDLANSANSLGYSVIDYKREFQTEANDS